MNTQIKTVGRSGQIALGQKFAGRHVLLTELEPGVWTLKLGEFVPDNEHWLYERSVAEALDRAVRWAEDNPPTEADLEVLEKKAERQAAR